MFITWLSSHDYLNPVHVIVISVATFSVLEYEKLT